MRKEKAYIKFTIKTSYSTEEYFLEVNKDKDIYTQIDNALTSMAFEEEYKIIDCIELSQSYVEAREKLIKIYEKLFNETVEELTQSLMPLFAKNGMDWMYANCSTTAQRGALDWMGPFHDAIKPVVQKLYQSVKSGNEAQISIDSNSKPDYREKLNEELKALRESEMWQTAVTVRKLRPENN